MPGEWHNRMEAMFPKERRECGFRTYGGGPIMRANRKTDVFLSNDRCLEIQHSKISRKEVESRARDWDVFGKTLIWLVDGNTPDVCIESLSTGHFFISFDLDWKHASFASVYEHILLEHDGRYFKIPLAQIKSNMVVIKQWKTAEEVVDILCSNPRHLWDEWVDDNFVRNRLVVHQQGAGNGKTYGIWKSIVTNGDKNHFVVITKQHSAKHVIYHELCEQAKRGEFHIENMVDPQWAQKPKHYVVKYTHKTSLRSCVVVIGTIDSFVYNVTTANKSQACGVFVGMLQNIIENGCTKLNSFGNMRFGAESVLCNGKAELWIDEVQDLPPVYFHAIVKIMHQTGMDVHVVGDVLQSLDSTVNFLTEAMVAELPNIDVVVDTPKNDNRRIQVAGMHDVINRVIRFDRYALPEISVSSVDPSTQQQHPDQPPPVEIIDTPPKRNDNDEAYINLIMNKVQYEVATHGYTPEDFLFIFPMIKGNSLVGELESRLNEFWISAFQDPTYAASAKSSYWKTYDHTAYTQYAYLHKHEDGTVINLSDSEHLSRLVTIKTSKGDGRNVVFVIDCTESALKCMTNQERNLVYESYLHVALTRAKRKLYVTLSQSVQDDISNRFRFMCSDNSSIPTIPFKIRVSDIMDHLDRDAFQATLLDDNERITELGKQVDSQETTTDGSSTDLVDWKYHCIRFSLCFFYTYMNLVNTTQNDARSQFTTLIRKIRNLDVRTYTVRGFYKFLKPYSRLESGDLPHLPLLNLSTTTAYQDYCTHIENRIRTVQKHLKTNTDAVNELQVYDMIVFRYMIDLYQKKSYSEITPVNLYDLTHFFVHHQTTTKERDLIEQATMMRGISDACIQSIVTNAKEDVHWNVNKSVWLRGYNPGTVSFGHQQGYPFVGYDSNTVYHMYLTTDMNEMNRMNVVFKIVLERFLLRNTSSEEDRVRYHGKAIVTYILVLKKATYLKLDWDWDCERNADITNFIKHAMLAFYEPYHKRVFEYLRHVIASEEWSGEGSNTPFAYAHDKIHEEGSKMRRPPPKHMLDALNEIDMRWKRRQKDAVRAITRDQTKFCDLVREHLEIAVNKHLGVDSDANNYTDDEHDFF
jgi:hypothetical protein